MSFAIQHMPYDHWWFDYLWSRQVEWEFCLGKHVIHVLSFLALWQPDESFIFIMKLPYGIPTYNTYVLNLVTFSSPLVKNRTSTVSTLFNARAMLQCLRRWQCTVMMRATVSSCTGSRSSSVQRIRAIHIADNVNVVNWNLLYTHRDRDQRPWSEKNNVVTVGGLLHRQREPWTILFLGWT